MPRFFKILLLSTLVAALAAPVRAQMYPGPSAPPPGYAPAPAPVAPVFPVTWAQVPTSPGVLSAQNFPGDLFRVENRYYYYNGGYWYLSQYPTGPWTLVTKKLPRALYQVDRRFFKNQPPW